MPFRCGGSGWPREGSSGLSFRILESRSGHPFRSFFSNVETRRRPVAKWKGNEKNNGFHEARLVRVSSPRGCGQRGAAGRVGRYPAGSRRGAVRSPAGPERHRSDRLQPGAQLAGAVPGRRLAEERILPRCPGPGGAAPCRHGKPLSRNGDRRGLCRGDGDPERRGPAAVHGFRKGRGDRRAGGGGRRRGAAAQAPLSRPAAPLHAGQSFPEAPHLQVRPRLPG